MRTLIAVIAALTLTVESAPAQEIAVGEPFPEVALPAFEDGSPTSIASYRGKKVFLHVFASW